MEHLQYILSSRSQTNQAGKRFRALSALALSFFCVHTSCTSSAGTGSEHTKVDPEAAPGELSAELQEIVDGNEAHLETCEGHKTSLDLRGKACLDLIMNPLRNIKGQIESGNGSSYESVELIPHSTNGNPCAGLRFTMKSNAAPTGVLGEQDECSLVGPGTFLGACWQASSESQENTTTYTLKGLTEPKHYCTPVLETF